MSTAYKPLGSSERFQLDQVGNIGRTNEHGEKRIALFSFDRMATAAEIFGDLVAVSSALGVAYWAYRAFGLGKGYSYPPSLLIETILGFAILFVLLLDREGVYRHGSGMLRISETERTLRASFQAFLLLFLLSIFSAHLLYRLELALSILLVPIAVVVEKQLVFSIILYQHTKGRGVKRAVIYGSGFTGKRVFSVFLRSRKLGIDPVVFVDDNPELAGKSVFPLGYTHGSSAPVISEPPTASLFKKYQADVLIVAIPSIHQVRLHELAQEAKAAGVTLVFVPPYTIYEDNWVTYADIDGIMVATVGPLVRSSVYERTKRVFDLVAGAVLLAAFSPLFAIIAALVRIDSKGPAFFTQKRVGKDGRIFNIYKFRTMWTDAPKYAYHPTTAKDDRITKVGRFLRKSSLDELPQLFNVIKGEMSLVGPRPEMPFVVESYGLRERQRLAVLPGITGLWQLSADRAYLIHENLQYDLYYIRNRGIFMDLAILLHTLAFVKRGR